MRLRTNCLYGDLLFYSFFQYKLTFPSPRGCPITCHHSSAKWDILLGIRDVRDTDTPSVSDPTVFLTSVFTSSQTKYPRIVYWTINMSLTHMFGWMSTPEKRTKNGFTSSAPVVHSQLVWTPASVCFTFPDKILQLLRTSPYSCCWYPSFLVISRFLGRWGHFAILTLQGWTMKSHPGRGTCSGTCWARTTLHGSDRS